MLGVQHTPTLIQFCLTLDGGENFLQILLLQFQRVIVIQLGLLVLLVIFMGNAVVKLVSLVIHVKVNANNRIIHAPSIVLIQLIKD